VLQMVLGLLVAWSGLPIGDLWGWQTAPPVDILCGLGSLGI